MVTFKSKNLDSGMCFFLCKSADSALLCLKTAEVFFLPVCSRFRPTEVRVICMLVCVSVCVGEYA